MARCAASGWRASPLTSPHAAPRGQAVVVVTSGAIALGARRLGLTKGGRASLDDAQAAAATGQIVLASAYAELLGQHGLQAAQILLTLGDLEDRRRYLNAAATLDRLLSLGVVPVVNENDSVATQEIRFGDNDRLAARVALAAGAGGVVLLSDVDGLYTVDPRTDASARLIAHVADLDAVAGMAGGTVRRRHRRHGGQGRRGADRRRRGHPAGDRRRARRPSPRDFAATGHGTVFAAAAGARPRKAWLAARATVAGQVFVDGGAARALAGGSSLLAAGVTGIAGDFVRGDAVEVVGPLGAVARGLIAYDAAEAAAIAGARNEAQGAILGYAPRAALIHRDQLVLL